MVAPKVDYSVELTVDHLAAQKAEKMDNEKVDQTVGKSAVKWGEQKDKRWVGQLDFPWEL